MAKDFFGNEVDDDFDPLAPANVRPSDAALADAAARREAERKRRVADQQYENRRDFYGAAPSSNYGLSLDPSTAAEARADQKQASDAMAARNGGLGGDLARLGMYAISGGPAAEATRAYLPQDVGDVLLNPTNVWDEVADQVIPGGSGARGGSLVPFLDNSEAISRVSGADQYYPSETIQSGSHGDGYRGVTSSGNTGVVSGLIDDVPGYPAGAAVADAVGGIGGALGGDPAAGLGQYAQRAQALGAGARDALRPVTAARDAQAQDMFARGRDAQARAAAQTGLVDYGPAQTVTAPTLASAQQAAMGDFGAEQRVAAATVGPAAQAQAQQAQATQAANQAGFLAGTAAGARGISDLDFALANESRTAMGDSLNRIRSFVDQGPGESQAQAQLRMAQEQSLGDALSLARSGRGNAAGNMKMALSENAATNAQTNMQAALLRANEADLWRGRQLQGLGLEQQGTTAMRGQDINMAQAQGQHAVSREQIASNVDVSRAGLEQGLAQFNAGAQNQASLTNAQLGTQVGIANAEQQNLGSRLQAQLSTDAAMQEAGLANARNVAMGQAGTQVGIANAEQTNLTNRLQGQLQSDAAIQEAALSNALAIAQGNSSTDLGKANLEAEVRQREANDAMLRDMYGYGLDSQRLGQDALTTGLNLERDYSGQAAELAAQMAKARAMQQAGLIGGGAAALEAILPW